MENLGKDDEKEKKEGNNMSFGLLAFIVIFPLALAAGVVVYENKKHLDLEERISNLENKSKKTK